MCCAGSVQPVRVCSAGRSRAACRRRATRGARRRARTRMRCPHGVTPSWRCKCDAGSSTAPRCGLLLQLSLWLQAACLAGLWAGLLLAESCVPTWGAQAAQQMMAVCVPAAGTEMSPALLSHVLAPWVLSGGPAPDQRSTLQMAVFTGKLTLVDLAGSERASETNNRGRQLRDGAAINRCSWRRDACVSGLQARCRAQAVQPSSSVSSQSRQAWPSQHRCMATAGHRPAAAVHSSSESGRRAQIAAGAGQLHQRAGQAAQDWLCLCALQEQQTHAPAQGWPVRQVSPLAGRPERHVWLLGFSEPADPACPPSCA